VNKEVDAHVSSQLADSPRKTACNRPDARGRAREGEKIGITRRGELTAVLVPAAPETSLRDIFQDIERIRKRVKLSRIVDVKELIEEGRLEWFLSWMLPLHFAGFSTTLCRLLPIG